MVLRGRLYLVFIGILLSSLLMGSSFASSFEIEEGDFSEGILIDLVFQPGFGLIKSLDADVFLNADENLTTSQDLATSHTLISFLEKNLYLFGGIYWQDNTGINPSTGSYQFDGIDDAIVFDKSAIESSKFNGENFTFSFAMQASNLSGNRSIVGTNTTSLGLNSAYLHIYVDESPENHLSVEIQNLSGEREVYNTNYSIEIDENYSVVLGILSGGSSDNDKVQISIKNSSAIQHLPAYEFLSNGSSGENIEVYLGATGPRDPNQSLWEGTIDYFQFLSDEKEGGEVNGIFNTSEREELLNDPSSFFFAGYGGEYKQIFNFSSLASSANTSSWDFVNITNATDFSGDNFFSQDPYGENVPLEVEGRAGPCGELENLTFSSSTRNDTVHTFNETLIGECFEARLIQVKNRTAYTALHSFSVSGTEIFNPSIDFLFLNDSAKVGDLLVAQFNVSSQEGFVSSLNVTWYVNNSSYENQSFSFDSNESFVETNFSTSNFSVGDNISFSAQADIESLVFSEVNESSLVTLEEASEVEESSEDATVSEEGSSTGGGSSGGGGGFYVGTKEEREEVVEVDNSLEDSGVDEGVSEDPFDEQSLGEEEEIFAAALVEETLQGKASANLQNSITGASISSPLVGGFSSLGKFFSILLFLGSLLFVAHRLYGPSH